MGALDRLAGAAFPWVVAWFALLLALRSGVVLRRGYRLELGVAKGSPRRGVLYSLSFSMLPWKKDSTRLHPWTYAAGMGMHLGIFASFVFALGRRLDAWPPWAAPVFGALAGLGLLSAAGLFVKRATKPFMRPITNPDDYMSNALVQLYLLGAFLTTFSEAWVGLWRASAVVLLFYVPLGKIFHMLLFFVSRTLFGLQFGRRGVLRHGLPVSY
jgi:hypothetical protein